MPYVVLTQPWLCDIFDFSTTYQFKLYMWSTAVAKRSSRSIRLTSFFATVTGETRVCTGGNIDMQDP